MNITSRTAALALCLGISCSWAAHPAKVPKYIADAVAESSRPDTDRARDADRKPDLVLNFAGIRPGDSVAELLPGRGYYTRLLCKVVGAKGKVYAIRVLPVTASNRPATEDPPNPCTNITPSSIAAAELTLPSDLDAVWTSENYHDLHNKNFGPADIKAFDTAVFNALKPGGVFIIEDHAAEAGSGARDTDTLHRIDPELVRQEVTAVGFKFAGASDVLKTADDPMTAKVFDLKGKTNKFLFKFRKPRK